MILHRTHVLVAKVCVLEGGGSELHPKKKTVGYREWARNFRVPVVLEFSFFLRVISGMDGSCRFPSSG